MIKRSGIETKLNMGMGWEGIGMEFRDRIRDCTPKIYTTEYNTNSNDFKIFLISARIVISSQIAKKLQNASVYWLNRENQLRSISESNRSYPIAKKLISKIQNLFLFRPMRFAVRKIFVLFLI